MKLAFKALAVVLVLCLTCACFVGCSDSSAEEEETNALSKKTLAEISGINEQIENNTAMQTYINNVALYEKLIKLDPTNIDWQVGLADTYRTLGNSSKYLRVVKNIVKLFPEDKTGHLMLIKYYEAKGYEKRVISTFKEAPAPVQADKEFLSIYQKKEWLYRVRGSKADFIGLCGVKRYVYEKDGLYGYKKSDFYSSITAKFTVARPFIEDYAAVQKDNEWYFIDTSGYRVLATTEKLEDLYSFSEGYAVAKINGKYGYIDKSFQKHHFEYEDATSFYNGVAAVKTNGKWALIDKEFKTITSYEFDDVVRDDANVCSRKNAILVHVNGIYHIINTSGKQVTQEGFSDVKPFYSEYAAVKRGDKWGFVDTKGTVVIDFEYDDASSFDSELAAVKRGNKWGCVTLDGKVALPFKYEDAVVLSNEGVVAVKIEDYYKFVQFIKFTV